MPLSTMASAIPRTNVSLTSQPKRFHVLNPMGGVAARVTVSPSASAVASADSRPRSVSPFVHDARRRAANPAYMILVIQVSVWGR